MGKRRKTAKTGDKALYKSRLDVRVSGGGATQRQSDDDGMYNAVDRFHNRRDEEDFLKLDAGGGDSEEDEDKDDGISGREGVLDLGGGENSSEEEGEDDSMDDEPAKKHRRDAATSEEEPISSDSDDEDDILNMEDSDVRDWGRTKSAYYHGDTADLEIGQDEDDAFLEEEAAKEVQAARYEQMDEDDFIMSDDEGDKKVGNEETVKKTINVRGTKDLSKLSRSDRLRLLQSHHPELIPLVSHFKHTVEEWNSRTNVVAKAVLDGDEGTIEVSLSHGISCTVGNAMHP
jgi:U3 small nucleolar RNA-associated protein 3